MAKKTKENNVKNTKDKKFNFDGEIVIGLKRVDEPKKPNKKVVQAKKKSTFKIIKWIILLAIIVAGGIYLVMSPIFNISNISVTGNSKISTDEIISLSKIELEKNLFKYRNSDIIKNIQENAYIETVQVSKKIPDTIEINIQERQPEFIIQFANAYAIIDNQGYILEISEKKQNLPLIEGYETKQEDLQVKNRLCVEDLHKLGDALKIMEAATSNDIAKLITKIDIKDNTNYILTLQKNKKTVYLGDVSDLSTKMLWILKFNEIEGNTAGEIILNMNLHDENSKPYFRKKV